MASNLALTAVPNRRNLNGFENFFRMCSHQWWGTRRWWLQILIWLIIINGPTLVSLISSGVATIGANEADAAEAAAKMEALAASAPAKSVGDRLEMYFILAALFPAMGVFIRAQDAFISGRNNGTIAWVLSKPVSRAAFVLSKLAADAIGILVTMVLVQGLVNFVAYRYALGVAIPPVPYLWAQGLLCLHAFFYLAMTYMLGALFKGRGPVIGIPLAFIFLYNAQAGMGIIGRLLPGNLVMDFGSSPALAAALVDSLPLPTILPIIGTAALSMIFILVTLRRINREEF
jgi:ABC-2 type transport system permease protein